jgi:transposase InsO family protein
MGSIPHEALLYVRQRRMQLQLKCIRDNTLPKSIENPTHVDGHLRSPYEPGNGRAEYVTTLASKDQLGHKEPGTFNQQLKASVDPYDHIIGAQRQRILEYHRRVPAPRITTHVLDTAPVKAKERERLSFINLLDTGSTADWVSSRHVPSLVKAGYELIKGHPVEVTVGNNLTFTTTGASIVLPVTVLAKSLPGLDNRQFSFKKEFHIMDLVHEDMVIGIETLDEVGLLDRLDVIYRAGRKRLNGEDVNPHDDIVLDTEIEVGSGDELDETLPEEITFSGNNMLQAHVAEDAPPSLQRNIQQLNERYDALFGELPLEGADMPHFPIETFDVPKGRPMFRQSEAVQIECDKQVQAYLDKGIISRAPEGGFDWPTTSPVLALKSDGSWRFCIDVSPTNKVTHPYNGPLPVAADLIDELAGKKYYACLDLTSGFHQAFIREEDRIKTAFRTRTGVYYFNRCPFGLKNIPAWWSEQMRKIFASEIGRTCTIYIDDICVYGNTEEEFLENLERIYRIAMKANLRFKAKKCHIGLKEMEYLGHIVNSQGKALSPARKEGIANLEQPHNVSELRTFLGTANYFHSFVPDFASIAKPLTEICSQPKTGPRPFTWLDEHQRAFTRMKQAIMDADMLSFPIPGRKLVLRTDASVVGVGGMLVQIDDNGKELPVCYVSKAFNATERRWSTYEQEAYGIVFSVLKLRKYLFGQHFTVETDHRNLMWIEKAESPKVIRWNLSLANYDFDIEHIPGVTNVVADGLSRLHPPTERKDGPSWLNQICIPVHNDGAIDDRIFMKLPVDVTEASLMELNVEPGVDGVEPPPSDALNQFDKAQLNRKNRLKELKAARANIQKHVVDWISECHNDVIGHHGAAVTSRLLTRNGHDWKGKRLQLDAYISHCPTCQKNRKPLRPNDVAPGFLSVDEPFEVMSMDFIGPIEPVSKDGFQYILVFVDHCTRFVELVPTRDCSAESACSGLISVFGRYGAPRCIRSDQGPHFTADVVKHFVKATGAVQKFVTPYHHESNGLVERTNLEVMRHLRSLVFDKDILKTWDISVPLVQRIINSTVHSATGYSPAQLLYGDYADLNRILLDRAPSVMPTGFTSEDYLHALVAAQRNLARAARSFQEQTELARQLRNKHPTESDKYLPGDLVLCNRTGRFASKLSMTPGPYIVRAEVKPDVYALEHPASGRVLKEVASSMMSEFLFDRTAYPDELAQGTLAEGIARLDEKELFVVDTIVAHRYAHRNKQNELVDKPASFALKPMSERLRYSWFKVHWLNYDSSEDTWEPYRNLKDNLVLKAWLAAHPNLDLVLPDD